MVIIPGYFIKKNIDSHSEFKLTEELTLKYQEICLLFIYKTCSIYKTYKTNITVKMESWEVILHLSDKVWLNSKYIKTKQTQKLWIKLFRHFLMLYSADKQTYIIKLLRSRKFTMFSMLLLEQNINRKDWVDKII